MPSILDDANDLNANLSGKIPDPDEIYGKCQSEKINMVYAFIYSILCYFIACISSANEPHAQTPGRHAARVRILAGSFFKQGEINYIHQEDRTMLMFRTTVICLALGLCSTLNAADGDLRAAGKIISDVATGQPPLQVGSTTVVPNLNADMLDGMHASDFALNTDGHYSVPLGAMMLESNAAIGAGEYVVLTPTGNSEFGSNWVVPADYSAGTDILFDVLIHNPEANGVCQAVVRNNFGRIYRPGAARDQFPLFGFAAAFPPFTTGDMTIAHRYRFKGAQPGDALLFGWFRWGDHSTDNCGDVWVVGVDIRYQKQ